MSANFIVEAEVRTNTGTAASRRIRRAGQVPVVVYGGGEDEQYLVVDHNKITHQLEVEAFHSALVQIKLGDELHRAILRDVHMHPYKAQVMHLDFQRVSRKDKITMHVPLHFVGEDAAPGVKDEGGIMTHNMNGIDISCLGSDLPEYIEVDVSALGLGDSVQMKDIKLPEGVEFSSSLQEADFEHSIASVLAPKKATVETEEGEGEEGEGVEGAEGAEGESAASE